jgi:phosphomannomutase
LYGFDDLIYLAIRLLDALIRENKPLSTLTSDLPKSFSTPEVRFEVDEKDKFPTVEKIVASVKDIATKDSSVTVNDIDGARVKTPDGWWLIRASNTQNVIVSRAESLTTEGLERLKSMVENEVAKVGYKILFEQSNH